MTLFQSLVSKIIEKITDVPRVRGPEEAPAPAPGETLFQAIKKMLTANETADKGADPDSGGRCEALRQLLDFLSPLEGFEEAVNRALHLASEKGLFQEAQVLLQHGADVNSCADDCSHSALTRAAMMGHSQMVKLLVQHGADIEHQCNKMTPLMLACRYVKLECMKTLLELGANAQTQGKTALLLVVEERSSQECLQFLPPLLQKGADPNIKTACGGSVEGALCDYVTIRFVEDEGWEDHEEFWERLRDLRDFVEVVSLLLRSGLSLRCCQEDCLLMYSLEYFPALQPLSALLLESGAAACPQDHVCWSRYEELFKALAWFAERHPKKDFGALLEQAAVLLQLYKADQPLMHVAGPAPPQDCSGPHSTALRDFHYSVRAQELNAPSLQNLCRGMIRRTLRPWPLETKVQALDLPSALKDFLLLKELWPPR